MVSTVSCMLQLRLSLWIDMNFGCNEGIGITLGLVDGIRCSVRIKFLNKTAADHYGKNDNTNEYCNIPQSEDYIRCELFLCVVYVELF
jgi:hypothetical protein